MLWRALGLPRRPRRRAGVHRRVGRGAADRCSERSERGSMFTNCATTLEALVAAGARDRAAGFARVAEVAVATRSSTAVARGARRGARRRGDRARLPSTPRLGAARAAQRLRAARCRCAPRCCASSLTPQLGSRRAARAHGRLRRPRRLHRAEPGARRRELNALVARFEALTYDTVARARRAAGEDDRRRGDVRRRGARDRAADRAASSPTAPGTTRCCPRPGPGWRAGRRSPGRATTTAPSSISPTGSSRSRTRSTVIVVGRAATTRSRTTTGFSFQRLRGPQDPRHRPGRDLRWPGCDRRSDRPGVGPARRVAFGGT